MDSSTEESDSRTAAFTNKRKEPSALQFELPDSDSGDKRLKLDTSRSKYNTLEPGEVSDATSFSRRPSKDSATSDEVHQVGITSPSGWTPIKPHPGITRDLPYKSDQCPQSFSRSRELWKHRRMHLALSNDPFVNSHQNGYESGADVRSADGTASASSHHHEQHPVASSARLNQTAPADNNHDHGTILDKLRRQEPISDVDYIAIARWLARNDAALTLSDISMPNLKRKILAMKNSNGSYQQTIAGALELLSYGANLYEPARAFLEIRFWAVMQSCVKPEHDNPAMTTVNQNERYGSFVRGVQSGEPISEQDHAAMARWLGANDYQLQVNHIQHKGLKRHVTSMLTSHHSNEQSGIAKALETISCGGQYHAIARTFIKQRYEAVNPSGARMEGHNDDIKLNGGAENKEIQSSESLDTEIDSDIQGEIQAGAHFPPRDYQHMARWLLIHHDGPKYHDIQEPVLKQKIWDTMKSRSMDENDNIAAILVSTTQRTSKRWCEKARAWFTEYYKSARKVTFDMSETEVNMQSEEEWLDRALAVAAEHKTDAVGLIRLDEIGEHKRLQCAVAKHVSELPHKSVEEALREAVMRKWDLHEHAAQMLAAGYEFQNITDGPRCGILKIPLLDKWTLEELEKVMRKPKGFLRPLVASDVIQKASHSELLVCLTNYMKHVPQRSFAQALHIMAKKDGSLAKKGQPASGVAEQCLADFVTITYVGGKGATSIDSRDGFEDLKQFMAAGQSSFKALKSAEEQSVNVRSNHDGSTPPPPPPTPPAPFDYGELARFAAAGNGSFPGVARVDEHARLTEQLDQNHGMEASQASPAEYELLQRRYFHASDSASFRCLCCGRMGHTETSCPSLTCDRCGAVDDHFSGACPANQKCGRCRQRGHLAVNCTTPSLSLVLGLNDTCDICGRNDHVEEECSELWRSSLGDDEVVNFVPEQAMRVNCYNCGATDRFGFRCSHWGNDCPKTGRCDRSVHGLNDTFSSKHADKFIQKKFEPLPQSAGHGSLPMYQLAMLGD